MAKSKRQSKKEGGKLSKPETGGTTSSIAQISSDFKLDRIALRRLSYTEIPVGVPPVAPPEDGKVNLHLSFEAKMTVFPIGVDLYLELKVVPDPKHMPIEILLGISGFFSRPLAASDQDITLFAQTAGALILFPYIRETISNITSRGLYDPIWLDPLFITEIFENGFRKPRTVSE